jgi:uncharacterized protein (DUF4415 family)
MKKKANNTKRIGAIDRFMALPDAKKEQIWQEIDRQTPDELRARSKPLTPELRKRVAKFKRKGSAGRPKLGPRGVKVIALSVERDLLDRVDCYAKKHGMKRAEFFSQAALDVLG